MRAERLEPKWYAVESGCLTSFRRELKGLPVYRADLNPPVLNAEHGNAAGLDHAGRGHPNRKAGRQEQPWDGRRSQSRFVMNRICPRRSGLERRERYVEPSQLGNCNRRATPVAWCTQKPLPTGARRRRPQPGIAKWSAGITMRSMRHRFPSGRGSVARKGLALERFEPCEGKLSRTVLRGAWAG
jgi:hypothetical protein